MNEDNAITWNYFYFSRYKEFLSSPISFFFFSIIKIKNLTGKNNLRDS